MFKVANRLFIRKIRLNSNLYEILKAHLPKIHQKKIISVISLIFIFLFLIIMLSPSRMIFNKFKKECEDYQRGIRNTPGLGVKCIVEGGCYDTCIGFRVNEQCSKRSEYFDSCKAICFGLNISFCNRNIFKRKIDFLSEIIKK